MSEMGLTTFETIAVWLVLATAILGLFYALFLRRQVLANPKGTAKIIEVWDAIRIGADAYLTRQLRTILPFIAVLTVLMFLSVYIVDPTPEAIERFATLTTQQLQIIIGLGRAGAFVMGAVFSLIVGQVGCAWRCRSTYAWPRLPARASTARCASPTGQAPSPGC